MIELEALNEYVSLFRKSGAELYAVSAQVPDQSRAFIERHSLNFEILYDPFNDFAQMLDLVHGFGDDLKQVYLNLGIDLFKANGQVVWSLAMPARIVVDSDHNIKSFECSASYTERPEPAETLAIVTSK